jgi:hypothetical protein
MALTGVFSFLDLEVVSASIKTDDSAGFIHDEFVVQTQDGSIVCSPLSTVRSVVLIDYLSTLLACLDVRYPNDCSVDKHRLHFIVRVSGPCESCMVHHVTGTPLVEESVHTRSSHAW